MNGDVNSSDSSYSYPVIAYYSTRDGKHWSQDKLVELTDVSGTLPDASKGVQIVKYLTKLYLVTAEGLISSPGCLEWNNPDPSETVDITSSILSYNSSFYDSRQTRLTLSNRDAVLSQTILGSGISLGMITKLGNHNYKFQVAVEEIDSIQPARERPNEVIEISARDRMGWINDRSANANALQWDNQVIGRDDFIDIGGNKNAGLAHTATVAGTFTTSNHTLVANTKYKENIDFNTYKAMVEDGHVAAIISIPNPTSQGGTNADDSPSYAGVIFRAVDKDNLWFCWYNYWTNKIELGERRNGSSLVYESITPSVIFQLLGRNGGSVGIRVEFKGARIRVYEGINYYSSDLFHGADYQFDLEYIAFADDRAIPRWLEGYVGVIGSGFSDQDNTTSDTPPDPIVISSSDTSWGGMSSFLPTRILAMNGNGGAFRALGTIADNMSWADVSMSGGNATTMAGSGGSVNRYSIIDSTQNPYNANQAIAVGSAAIAVMTNPFNGTAAWSVKSLTPQSNYTFGYMGGYGNNHRYGKIEGSINVPGYFGWLEFPTAQVTLDPIYYCWTTDNFVTMHRTNTGLVNWLRRSVGGQTRFGYDTTDHFNDYNVTMTIGCFASSISNLNIWIIGGNAVSPVSAPIIKHSVDGGNSFSTMTYTMTMGDPPAGIVNMPLSKSGGGNNTSYNNLLAIEGQTNYTNNPTQWAFKGVGGNEVLLNRVFSTNTGGYADEIGNTARMLQSLTIDANYIAVNRDRYLSLSSDGGHTWTDRSIFTLGSSNVNSRAPGLNGWPTNPNFYILWDRDANYLKATANGGTSFVDPVGTSIVATPDTKGWVCAYADFSEVYPTSGIHP